MCGLLGEQDRRESKGGLQETGSKGTGEKRYCVGLSKDKIMKQTVEEAKIKKVKAEMEIARILENLELETGLKSNIVYVYRENAKSEPLSQPKECIRIDIILTLC